MSAPTLRLIPGGKGSKPEPEAPERKAPDPRFADGLPFEGREGKKVVYGNLKAADCTRQGVLYPGKVEVGWHAEVTPRESIRIFGHCKNSYGVDANGDVLMDSEGRHVIGRDFDLTFKVGEQAVHSAYNLTYTGKILAIGAKTIAIEGHSSKTVRLTIRDFVFWNRDYDARRIEKHNRTEMECI